MLGDNNSIWEQRAEKDHFTVMYSSKNPIFKRNINKIKTIVSFWVNNHKGKLLLDVGCGDGILAQEFKNKEIYGIDISKRRIARAKKRVEGKFLVGDAEKKFRFKNNIFDIVIVVNVLEYLKSVKKFFSEIKRILKKDGILILSFPNKLIVGNIYYKDAVNFKRYSKQKIKTLLNKTGFKIIDQEKVGFGVPNWNIFKNLQFFEKILPKIHLILAKNEK